MPFRDQNPAALATVDPLERFFAIEAAFEQGRGLLGDRTSLRLASAQLVRIPGEPDELVAAVRNTDAVLSKLSGFNLTVAGPLWMLVAGVLIEHGDVAEGFVAELGQIRGWMREVGMRRYAAYEIIAALALRLGSRPHAVGRDQVARVQAIYDAMKRHHWWLTGPEDLPACAVLGMTERSPAELAGSANAIYEGLRRHARAWPGDLLQTASNILAVSPLQPTELVERYTTLVAAFERRGVSISFPNYGDVAALCFLAQPAERIAETVQGYTGPLYSRLSWADGGLAFTLAAHLAFTRLLGDDPLLGILASAKALFDMQKVIEAQSSG